MQAHSIQKDFYTNSNEVMLDRKSHHRFLILRSSILHTILPSYWGIPTIIEWNVFVIQKNLNDATK